MNTLERLEAERESAKLAFEAAWRTGCPESEAWAMKELIELDRKIQEAKARDNGK